MELDFDITALEEYSADSSSLPPLDAQAPSISEAPAPVALQTRSRSNSNKRVLTPSASSDGVPSTSPGKAYRSDLTSDVTLSRSKSSKHESARPVELAPRFRTALTIHSDNSNDSSSNNFPPPPVRAAKSSSTGAKIISTPKSFSEFLAAESGSQFKCPYCPKAQMNEPTLVAHVLDSHRGCNPRSVCPICAAGPGGDPNYKSQDLFGHMQARHRRGTSAAFSPFPSSSSNSAYFSAPMGGPMLTPAPAAVKKDADGNDESAEEDPSSSEQQANLPPGRRNDEGGVREWLLLEPQTLNVQQYLRGGNSSSSNNPLYDYLCAHDRQIALIEREQGLILSCTYANHFAEERKYFESIAALSGADTAMGEKKQSSCSASSRTKGFAPVNRSGHSGAPDICSLCISHVKGSESHAIFPCGHGMHFNCLPIHLHQTSSPSCPLCFPIAEEEGEKREKKHKKEKEKAKGKKCSSASSNGPKKDREKEKEKEEEEKEKPEKPDRRKSSRSHSKKAL